jgi:hypothetical protein
MKNRVFVGQPILAANLGCSRLVCDSQSSRLFSISTACGKPRLTYLTLLQLRGSHGPVESGPGRWWSFQAAFSRLRASLAEGNRRWFFAPVASRCARRRGGHVSESMSRSEFPRSLASIISQCPGLTGRVERPPEIFDAAAKREAAGPEADADDRLRRV